MVWSALGLLNPYETSANLCVVQTLTKWPKFKTPPVALVGSPE
jgi:hypothetical protein